MKPYKSLLSPSQSPGFWAIFLLTGVILVQFLSGAYTLQVTRQSKENELDSYLDSLGRIAQEHFGEDALEMSKLYEDLQGYNQSNEIYTHFLYDEKLPEKVEGFYRLTRLSEIYVLDADGLILYKTGDKDRMLTHYEFWDIDGPRSREQLINQNTASTSYRLGNQYIKRYYLPVLPGLYPLTRAPDPLYARYSSDTRAYIALVAGRDFLIELAELEQRVWRAGAALMVVLMVVAFLIWRLIVRSRMVERKAAESDRLASLGTLAAGFAHEVRNPLGIIRAMIEDLERELKHVDSMDDTTELCRDLIEEVDRMNNLVSGFLDYSHGARSTDHGATAKVISAVRSVINILGTTAGKQGIEIRLQSPVGETDSHLWQARIDPAHLRQVLMNICLNAVQFSPEGGRVTIFVRALPRKIQIEITDQGPGVHSRDALRIFEPFFTTRSGGSGLGLSVSRQIVESCGGNLELLNSTEKQGTRFRISLRRRADLNLRAAGPEPTMADAFDTQHLRESGNLK